MVQSGDFLARIKFKICFNSFKWKTALDNKRPVKVWLSYAEQNSNSFSLPAAAVDLWGSAPANFAEKIFRFWRAQKQYKLPPSGSCICEKYLSVIVR